MGQKTIIELNGKQYDAVTGALLGESRVKATPTTRAKHHGRAIDGVFRGNKAAALAPTVIKPTATPAKPVAKPQPISTKKTMDVRRSPKNVKAHQPERAKTLMRHVVAKPKVEKKPAIKPTAPSEVMAKPTGTLAKPLEKKVSVTQVNPVRLARSRQISRSHHIRRYSPTPAPIGTARPAIAPHPAQLQYAARPVASVRPEPTTSPSQALRQAAAEQENQKKAADIFEAALAHANSHQEPLQPKQGRRALRRRRLINLSAGLAAFVVIGGFLAYLNMPKIELRVASMRAGFSAQIPSYQPMGYALDGGVKAEEGRVELTYRSGDSAYRITQQTSDWNSATLLDQKTEQRGAPDDTIQSNGRIIYIYDNATATWVDGGVLYEINSDAGLGQDDLVSLATSM